MYILQSGGSISQQLRKVMVPAVSDTDCRASYGAEWLDESCGQPYSDYTKSGIFYEKKYLFIIIIISKKNARGVLMNHSWTRRVCQCRLLYFVRFTNLLKKIEYLSQKSLRKIN